MLSWDGKQLKKLKSVGVRGKPCYYPWRNLSNDHETKFLRFVGNSSIDLICPPEGDDDEEQEKVIFSSSTSRPSTLSSSNNLSTMSFEDIFMILEKKYYKK